MIALVTGGCGFIASNFINIMKEKYDEIQFLNIDKLEYCSNVHNVHEGKCEFLKGDISDSNFMSSVFEKYKFDAVFHFAAQSHVDNSFEQSIQFSIDNTLGTHVLMEMCRRYNPTVEIIHFSTDEVYGESKTNEPFVEDVSVLRPTNPYSASKAGAEMIVRSYIESFGMNAKIIRCNNVYGPNQYPEKIIPKFKRLLKSGKKCTIHGTQSSNIKRAFIHVDDVVNAVDIVWKNGKTGEVYNIASDNELTVMEVTKLIIKSVLNTENFDEHIEYIKDRPFNDGRYYICANKLKSLGWKQRRGIEDLIKFLKE